MFQLIRIDCIFLILQLNIDNAVHMNIVIEWGDFHHTKEHSFLKGYTEIYLIIKKVLSDMSWKLLFHT